MLNTELSSNLSRQLINIRSSLPPSAIAIPTIHYRTRSSPSIVWSRLYASLLTCKIRPIYLLKCGALMKRRNERTNDRLTSEWMDGCECPRLLCWLATTVCAFELGHLHSCPNPPHLALCGEGAQTELMQWRDRVIIMLFNSWPSIFPIIPNQTDEILFSYRRVYLKALGPGRTIGT